MNTKGPEHYAERKEACLEFALECRSQEQIRHLVKIAKLYDQLFDNPNLDVPASFNNA